MRGRWLREVQGKVTSSRNSRCEGPETELSFACSERQKEAWSSLVAQWVKDLLLSLLWHRFYLCISVPSSSACHSQKKKKKKKKLVGLESKQGEEREVEAAKQKQCQLSQSCGESMHAKAVPGKP